VVTEPVPRIKVCGVRSIEDLPAPFPTALAAVGFVNWSRSPRQVTAERAARVIDAIPRRVLPVAVMVEPSPEEAERWLRASGCRVVQLCGYETPEEWIGFPFGILRRIAVDETAQDEIECWSSLASGFVLDHPAAPGGTGARVDTTLARAIAARGDCMLAGGLDPENVAELVRAVRPRGVDASSRLERADGRKDPARIAAFVEAAERALFRPEAAT
jgi:phosphoribosylanthranilate isomerase